MAMRKTQWLINSLLCILCVVVLVWMFVIGQAIGFEEQAKFYELLRNVSGIMFGVFGLWIGLLYPGLREKVFRSSNSGSRINQNEDRDAAKEANHLLEPFFTSLAILLIAFLFGILGPIARRVEELRPHSSLIRGCSCSFVGLLSILQIATIFRAMKITDLLTSSIARRKAKNEKRNRIRQNRTRD